MQRILSAIAVAASVGGLAACSMFPREMYPRVPSSTPDSVVAVGTDTFHFYASSSYEMYAPSLAAIDGARGQVDHAATEFRRYFGAAPSRLTVLLFDNRRGFDRFDFAARARGGPVLAVLRPVELQERLARTGQEEFWPVSRDAMRLFYLAYVDAKDNLARPDSGGRRLDMRRGHERMPDWFDEAVITLGTMTFGMDGGRFMRRNSRSPMPLAELLAMTHPLAGELRPSEEVSVPVALAEPGRGQRGAPRATVERALLFSAQASALAEYLIEKEGPLFIGVLADGFARGATMAELLHQANRVPREVPALERAWREWLEERGGPPADRRAAPSRAAGSASAARRYGSAGIDVP